MFGTLQPESINPQGHVVYYPFGRTFADDNASYLDELRHYLNVAPPVSPIMAKMVIREIYEKSYGIHDHANAQLSPLHLVRMHPKENVNEYSMLYNKIGRFIDFDVAKVTGMGMAEFFDQPHDVVEYVFRKITEMNRRKTNEPDPSLLK